MKELGEAAGRLVAKVASSKSSPALAWSLPNLWFATLLTNLGCRGKSVPASWAQSHKGIWASPTL